jgi:hypothetical protein
VTALDPAKVREAANPLSKIERNPPEDEGLGTLSPVKAIDVDYTDANNKNYRGKFVFRVPAIGDQIEIARMKAIYLPTGAAADPNGVMLVEMICYLEVTLQKPRPEWWSPHKFYDQGILSEVYGRCLDYEAKFLGRRPAEASDRQGTTGGEENDGTTHDTGEGAVAGSVQPSRKRREVLTGDSP